MKKSFLLSLLFLLVFSATKAQTVLDRILQQSKTHFQSTTWVDTSETKFYYDSIGLMTRKTITDLAATTPYLFEIDTNSYDSIKRLKTTIRYYRHRGATVWWGPKNIEFSYNGNLLAQKKDKHYTYDYTYNTDSTLKESKETQGSFKTITSYHYNSSKEPIYSLTTIDNGNNVYNGTLDSFFYSGGKLVNDITYKWNRSTKNWDSLFTRTYNYNTNGTLKEKTVLLHQLGHSYGWNRYLYFYKTLSLNIDEINKTKNVKIYPNPTSGKFTVKLADNTSSTISITDLTGKQVFTSKATGDFKVDLSQLTKGVYIVNVLTNNKLSTQKIVIQ